jgi:hypothetical protein
MPGFPFRNAAAKIQLFAGIDEDTADEFCKNPDNTYLLNHVLVSGF